MTTHSPNPHEVDAALAGMQDQLQSAESVPVSIDYFRVGTPVQLTVSEKSQVRSAYSVFLGFRAGRFLLVELPAVDGRALVINPGSAIRVRYLLDGRLLGFSCESMKVQFSPERLMFLKYPKRVDQLALRRHERVRVSLPTLARAGDSPLQIPGNTRDVSVSGCGVEFGPEARGVFDPGAKVVLYFKVPGEESLFKARTWVRMVKKQRGGGSWVGCEFDFSPGEEETRTLIERLVLARTGMISTSDLDGA